MTQNKKPATTSPVLRWSVIAAIAVVALFASYGFAQARGVAAQAATPVASTPVSGAVAASGGGCCGGSTTAASGVSGGSCCGGGAKSGPATTGQAAVSGGVQKLTVDLSKGYFDPDTIVLKAGVPAEITFGQGSGCLSAVQSQQLGFYQDLTHGPVTIKLPALAAGMYTFTCGMQMQSGTIVVK
jgi:hypothetical protein